MKTSDSIKPHWRVNKMPIGKVKWFNNTKKFGFILCENRDIFVHFSAILKDGYKTLKKDQMVEFDIVRGEKGETAVHVVALSELKLAKHEQEFFARPPASVKLKEAS